MKKVILTVSLLISLISLANAQDWTLSGSTLFTNYNVGINTNIAPEKLSVNGNIVANGSISGTSLNVIDIISSGKEFKISTSMCMKGIDANIPGSRNEICGMNGDLFIQSENGNNYNTVFNFGNAGKVGFGLIPTDDFHVGVKARFEERVYMSHILPIDSVFSIGENTLHFSSINNTIYGSLAPGGSVNGIGLGAPNAFGQGLYSVAIGYKVRASANNSVVIGSTAPGSNQLVNSIPNSLMIGFNSDKPTLTVLPGTGNNTYGKVGIGTDNPNVLLHVHAEADPLVGAYGILSTSNIPNAKSISVIQKAPGIDQENFIVYTDGRVYCREVFVKLGQLGDFVFDDDYDLMTYAELENYLKQNHHLPGVPSEPEVLTGGLNVGEMQAKVLQKTEENTLYILDLNKRLEEKEKENVLLKNELNELKKKQAELDAKLTEVLNKK